MYKSELLMPVRSPRGVTEKLKIGNVIQTSSDLGRRRVNDGAYHG